jgi:two-component system osmolarity sensor histidine kinase EnvZ
MPNSLVGRTALVLFVALLLSQLVSAALFHHFQTVPRVNLNVRQFVMHLKTIRAALDTLAPPDHSSFINALNEREGIRILRVRPGAEAVPAPPLPAVRVFRQRIREVLGSDAEVYVRPQTPRLLFVRMSAGDAEYWIAFPRGRVERDVSWAWLGWAAASAVIALVVALFIVRRINRPLLALTRAAQSLARGDRPPLLSEQGPREIATVAREFNRMSEALRRVESERAAFLAGVSHDLRTPITRVRLGLEMSGADAASREAIAADLEEMNQVIEQFMHFARDESGEPLAAVDLGEVLQRLVARTSREGVSLVLQIPALPVLLARPLAIQRLFANLLDNALKYGGDQPIEVGAEVQGDSVVVTLSDRGPGIPIAEVERLKQPFTRLDASRGGPLGAGLGLAIADRIARLHGGALDLLARAGGGLVARVTLPIGAVGAYVPG